jgi:hypothetical protein
MTAEHREPIVKNGEIKLGRHATLYHVAYGPLDRSNGPERVDHAKFRVSESPDRLTIEYSAEQLAAAWEDELFESPLHAAEVLEDSTDTPKQTKRDS